MPLSKLWWPFSDFFVWQFIDQTITYLIKKTICRLIYDKTYSLVAAPNSYVALGLAAEYSRLISVQTEREGVIHFFPLGTNCTTELPSWILNCEKMQAYLRTGSRTWGVWRDYHWRGPRPGEGPWRHFADRSFSAQQQPGTPAEPDIWWWLCMKHKQPITCTVFVMVHVTCCETNHSLMYVQRLTGTILH